ncbi:hypothetical protein NBRC10512_004641 [Rhodotorula toruloides]|uniref:RHTO0S10e01970g1_1 n=2 Tax=Rhodotorula toruloides TaxID=5286 RepID=A0A061BD23_RHOTO|nr:ABC bile acid transporter [Rhodotorula toruloides NP11]EMS19065.1 ABC bile acid transporter [Rhodotorula toruloides NP11]CDR44860.1 RHTO0S10e01970g1_1 [Rhodotorula toruloides]
MQLILDAAQAGEVSDAWCARGKGAEVWDGIDFDPCFRLRVFDGVIPLLFLSLSASYLLVRLFSLARRSFPRSSFGYEQLPTVDASSRGTAGSSPIAQAESRVLREVAEKQSPDWHDPSTQKELLGDDAEPDVVEADPEAEETGRTGLALAARAVWGCKKDVLNVVANAAMLALCTLKTIRAFQRGEGGRAWVATEMASWAWAFILSVAKVCLAIQHRVFALSHPSLPHRNVSPAYTLLERILIPYYVSFASLTGFFDLRSALLGNKTYPYTVSREALAIEAVLFATSSFLFIVEFFTPRPSRYSSRSSRTQRRLSTTDKSLPPSPEMHASLFSLATFSFLEGFQLRSAFPRIFGAGSIKMDTIPDLRADDKTARVVLSFRQSMRTLDTRLARLPLFIRRRILSDPNAGVEGLGLTPKLIYHFWPALVAQNIWSLGRVVLNPIAPLMLRGILAHIAKRERGEYAPFHVPILYAWGMFLGTILGGICSSQGLFIGRRICIRLRSIIVGEVFTKALRRKDQAGLSSAKPTEEADVSPTADAAPKPTSKATPASGSEADDLDEEELGKELEKASSGKIINLISVDTYRLSEVCAYLHFLLSEMPLSIIVICYLLFDLLGTSAAVGIAVLTLLVPIQGRISALFNIYQEKLLAAADQRLELTTEVIGQVRVVKFFAWERKFLEMMDATRKKELSAIWKRALTMVAGNGLMFGAPFIVGSVTFVFHTKVLERPLTAETAFTALALLQVLRSPLEGFTDMFVNVLQAYVSLKRLDAFMQEEETHKYSLLQKATSLEDPVIGFVDGTFTWSNEDAARQDTSVFRLKDLDLRFPEGQLSIILGPVGSGKTTLLQSLLGETNRLSGSAFLPSPVIRSTDSDPAILTETTAYASQQPWLLSATIRENILFGSPFNAKRYQATLDACALQPDLKALELGDDTEVGEKGTVLSGGQKARISLARAIYSPARYVLLDDVLSAVDSHTAQHLVEKCLTGKVMRHRTCVLVTHAVDLCLPVAGFVVTLDQSTVVSAGPPDTLSQSRLLELEKQDKFASDANESSFSTIEALADGETDEALRQHQEEERRKRAEKLKLVKDETQSEGAVKKEVYYTYIRAFGGWSVALVALAIFVGAQLADIAISLALRYWANSFDRKAESFGTVFVSTVAASTGRLHAVPIRLAQAARSVSQGDLSASSILGEDRKLDSDYWLAMYCLLAVVNLAFITARAAFFLWRGLCASRILYRRLISQILGAPIRFFDSTPTGRILNRLSKDMETIDQDLSQTAMYYTFELVAVAGITGTVSATLPAFLLAAAAISAAYWLLGYIYVASSRELKRFESVTRSPIFSVFGESLQGVSTIRAYGDASRFMRHIFQLLDENNRPFFTLWLANRWLSLRTDVFGAIAALIAALFVIFARSMDAALAGFVLSFALMFQERLLWIVRLNAQIEVQANSVERIQEYLELEQESQGGVHPPAIWPTRGGTISVNKLTASYAPNLPSVLKAVSFEVKGGEKVGIVGRTGSGKSSLALSFFRFIEPSSGNITIDGIDINTLKLEDLRSRLTIVAQEAALFAGSLRFNLDPFGQHEDQAIWDALRRVQMAAPGACGVTPKPTPGPSRAVSPTNSDDEHSEATATAEDERYVVKSLDMPVKEGGKNFSAGQRQLLALARGILKLRSSSILILDESTASLDHATDERIQETIRSEMADATILCIAHRLRTVIDYNKILVLDHGVVKEFDTPSNLLADADSMFSALCQKSGEYDVLKKMADDAARQRGEL